MALHAKVNRIHTQQCGCCHAHNTKPLCSLPDDTGTHVVLSLCAHCGALTPGYTQAQHEENTRRQTAYYENKWADDSVDHYNRLAEDFRGVVRFYRDKGYLPPPDNAPCIVDIGAGRGALVEALRREGYAARGAEPAQALVERACANYKMGASVLHCMTAEDFVAQLSQAGNTIDAAFLWHVIEHVKQPVQLLTAIAATLSAHGVIILQAPLPMPSSIFPEHLFLLTRKTVFSLAQMSGLAVAFCDISHQEQFISFVLCKPGAYHPNITPEQTDVLDDWISDLHAAIIDLDQTCTGQRHYIAEQQARIDQQQQTLDRHHQAFNSTLFLAKRLLYVLLRRKSHG